MEELLKKEVLNECKKLITDRMDETAREIEKVKEAAESETKSSMGDKYETGREMLMQERTKLTERLKLLSDQSVALGRVEEKQLTEVKFGSLVQTDQAWYLIAVALGPVKVGSQQVFVVSQAAPLVRSMLGKQQGSTFTFNGKSQTILKME